MNTDEFGERFRVLRRLGEGGMGVVYEAFDEQRQTRVALKTMRQLEPTTMYRLKNEFRALADLVHPNLVSLHELVSEPTRMFFSMELVDGISLLEWVGHRDGESGTTIACDLDRLRKALIQLVIGLGALHGARKLHRDVKPSNVLVTREGRVVLLDFGLVTELVRDGSDVTVDQSASGTAEYMSPEQAAGETLSEASDWYSVGVILHQALTGRLPFSGGRLKMLMDKQQFEPPAPSTLVSGVPEDLDSLSVDLLRRDPARRPSGASILRRLGHVDAHRRLDAPPMPSAPSTLATLAAPFIGREPHLGALGDALALVRARRPAIAFVHGSSGMGKSLLVRRFVDLVNDRGDAVVFAARCYERESVPFKALDGIVDAIGRHLRKLPRDRAEALLPREVLTLARVFPVLMRVEAIASAPRRAAAIPDPQEVRRRAFAAMRELVGRLADRDPLVIWIDDLQWGDSESAALLAEIFRPPDTPCVLFVGSYRSEEVTTSPLLRALLDPARRSDLAADVREIEVGPLRREDAEEMVRALLPADGNSDGTRVSMIAEESRGIPFYVDELVRHVQSGEKLRVTASGATRLETMLLERVAALPDDAQRLLEVVALAGRPIPRAVAVTAADLAAERETTGFGLLRTAHLVRTVRTADRNDVETYHDRVRVAVAQSLSPDEAKRLHERLAKALVAAGTADPETLAAHFLGAGDEERAGKYMATAAEKAAEALAFDRAASLYRRALDLCNLGEDEARALRWKLGDALAQAGRGRDAAHEYEEASKGARAADALELRRRVAEQLLFSGHVEEGMVAIAYVLRQVGMKLPATPLTALLYLAWNMLWLRVRGLGFEVRDASQLSQEALTRVDVCWSANVGLALVDPIRATAFAKRQALLALKTGEPHRVARALATEVVATSLDGVKSRPRTRALFAKMMELATSSKSAHARGFGSLCGGMAAFVQGDAREAIPLLESALVTLREECTGVAWETGTTEIFILWSLYKLGHITEMSMRLPPLLKEALARGDLHLSNNLRIGLTNMVWLLADDAAEAERQVELAGAAWKPRQPLTRYYELIARAHIDLYEGRGEEAWRKVKALWVPLGRTMVFRVQSIRLEAQHLRARCALAAAEATDAPGSLLAVAASMARKLARSGVAWAEAGAQMIQAGIASIHRDAGGAIALLERAERIYRAEEMLLYVEIARCARGLLLGERGASLVEEAQEALRAQQMRAPDKVFALLAPGFSARA